MIRRMAPNLAALLRLMLVTDAALLAERDLLAVCRAAVRGGVTCVELRHKGASPRELVALARELVAGLDVPVLVNDRVDVALAAGAAGAHLGPGDLPLRLARRVVPPGFLLGASVGRDEWAGGRGAEADYWGVGPWATTATKEDAGPALGASGFRAVVAESGGIPCIAIGGIRPDHLPEVRRAGGVGVAVVSGILRAADVEQAARAYR